MMGQLGKYKVLEPVGAGGQATVYRAEDSELGRIVALKVVTQPVSADPKYINSLRKEAVIASNLSHPNIATIYDFLIVDNKACIVMEFFHEAWIAICLGRQHYLPNRQQNFLSKSAPVFPTRIDTG